MYLSEWVVRAPLVPSKRHGNTYSKTEQTASTLEASKVLTHQQLMTGAVPLAAVNCQPMQVDQSAGV
jgi:hypothetical protein